MLVAGVAGCITDDSDKRDGLEGKITKETVNYSTSNSTADDVYSLMIHHPQYGDDEIKFYGSSGMNVSNLSEMMNSGDIVKISAHKSACPSCGPLNGNVRDYIWVADNVDKIYHKDSPEWKERNNKFNEIRNANNQSAIIGATAFAIPMSVFLGFWIYFTLKAKHYD